MVAKSSSWQAVGDVGNDGARKVGVDEISETLHTLPSSRLTNKTICRQAAGSAEQVL
jgi:hypothetical protein